MTDQVITPPATRKHRVDLRGHHTLCEVNFHLLLSMLPGIFNGVETWAFFAGSGKARFDIQVKVTERAPYTTTVSVAQQHNALGAPQLVVRLYRDVAMAEMLSWDRHRGWLPQYPYPNPAMYHPDEKLALNRFLNDWLKFFRRQGMQQIEYVN